MIDPANTPDDISNDIPLEEEVDEPLNGPIEEQDEAGNPTLNATLVNGSPHGLVTLWDDEGRPTLRAEFNQGVPHGPMVVFSDGLRQMEMTFVEGLQHGMATTYGPDESILSQTSWVNGVLQGEAQHFDPQGHCVRVETYVDGKLHGPATDYYPTGAVQQEAHWVEGVLHGDQIIYGSDGTQLSRIRYVNGEATTVPETKDQEPLEVPAPVSVRDRLLAQWRGKAP